MQSLDEAHALHPCRTPCGFCFVEYYTHAEALACLRYVSGTKLDERIVRCDLDLGYKEGRQFGRGKSGGQVRDEHRQDYDAGRGGWGAQAAKQQQDEERRRKEREEVYGDSADYPGAVAGGGGDWKQSESSPASGYWAFSATLTLMTVAAADVPSQKRGRDEDEDDDEIDGRAVSNVASPISANEIVDAHYLPCVFSSMFAPEQINAETTACYFSI